MIPKSNDMRFEITTKCNYNCVICPRDRLTRKIETMGLGLFRSLLDRILRETDQYDTLTFPGMGEPLLDETLDQKIMYAKQKKLNVLILTNGSLLTPARFRVLEDLGVLSIRVSFYGDRPEEYARVHGIKKKGAFEAVKGNLEAIAAMKRRTKLLLTFNAVKGINDDCIEGWVGRWKDKADLIEVWRPHNWVDGRAYRKTQEKKLKTCGRPFCGPLQVQVDGTVNMCCFDFNGKLTLGDLKRQSLEEIFSSGPYEKLARLHTSGLFRDSALICEDCDQRNMDKSDVMIYNSKFDVKDRVNKISTTYQDMLK